MTLLEESAIAQDDEATVKVKGEIEKELPMRIPVVEGQRLNSGVRVFVGAIPVKYLLQLYKVPYRDAVKKEGYQRKPQETRISRFSNSIKNKRVDVPTSILLNVRDVSVGDVIESADGVNYLVIDENTRSRRLFVVDGQHRVEAFRKLCEDDFGKWADFSLQFVLMVGAPQREEVNQFYIVNTEAKSVRTDLALDLLKHRAESDSRVMEEAIERGQDWKIEAQAIADELNLNSPVWRGKIRMANSDKADTIIPSASFVTSLRPLLVNSPFFKTLSRDQRVKVLDAYWQGIRTALREPFDMDPDDYSLQKGIGVTAMHETLVNVIEVVRSKGESVFDRDAYAQVMEPVLERLEGDNTEGENVRGPEFWLNAKLGGAAGSYSSSAGRRVLFAKIRGLLPGMDVE